MGRKTALSVVMTLCMLVGGSTYPASGAVVFAGACLMTIEVDFTPSIDNDLDTGSMDFEATAATCAGTDVLDPADISTGTSSGTISCKLIQTDGSATLTYSAAAAGTFDATFAGNSSGLTLLMLPGSAVIAGVGAMATLSTTGNCATGISSMTLLGLVVFSDPSV